MMASLSLAVDLRAADDDNTLSVEALNEMSLEDLLNTTVVTASSAGGEERAMTSANVFVVTRERIEANGWRSLAQILASVPGLYLTDNYVQRSVSVRGVSSGLNGGSRIVRVMIDGHPVSFQPELSAWLGPEFIPVGAIERVEIAKGPLSALHGANAFLATVNVITLEPTEEKVGTVEVYGGARETGGKERGGQMVLAHQAGRHSLVAAVSLDRQDRSGVPLPPQVVRSAAGSGPDAKSIDDVAQPVSAFGKLAIEAGKAGKVTFAGGLQRQDSAAEFVTGSVLTHESRVVSTNTWVEFSHEKTWSDAQYSASLGYAHGEPNERDSRLFATGVDSRSYQPQAEYSAFDAAWRYSHTLFDGNLTLGAGLDAGVSDQTVLYYTERFEEAVGVREAGDELDLIDADDPRQVRVHELGLGLNATSTPFAALPNLHLTGNLRVDRIAYGTDAFPLQQSWRAAAAYRWSRELVTKVVLGRAFQAPSAVLLFARPGLGSVNNLIGNRLTNLAPLEPQQVQSVEAVTSLQPLDELTLELAFYQQTLQNKVEFLRSGNNFVAVNRDDRTSLGAEIAVHAVLGPLDAELTGTLDRAYDAEGFAAAQAESYPSYWVSAILELDLSDLYLRPSSQVTLVGARGASQANIYLHNSEAYSLPSYARWDLTLATAGLTLIDGLQETKFRLSVYNVLNASYAEPGYDGVDIPGTGRITQFGIKQDF